MQIKTFWPCITTIFCCPLAVPLENYLRGPVMLKGSAVVSLKPLCGEATVYLGHYVTYSYNFFF